MQNELNASHPQLSIRILAVNEWGQEAGNSTAVVGRTLPLLQDVNTNGDGRSDAWLAWNSQWRDLVIVDSYNRQIGRLNLTSFNLATPNNYAALKQVLIDTAAMSLYPPAPSCAAADLNDDLIVNAADVRILAQAFGSTVATPGSGADLDRDGRVTLRDMIRLRQFLGQSCTGSSPIAPAAAVSIADELSAPSRPTRLASKAVDSALRERRESPSVQEHRRVSDRPLSITATPQRTRLLADRRGVRGSDDL